MSHDAILNGHPVTAHLDPGATHVFVSPNAAKLCLLHVSDTTANVQLEDKSSIKASGNSSAYFELNGNRVLFDVFVLSMADSFEGKPLAVFGKQWVMIDNSIADWQSNCIHIPRNDGSEWTTFSRNPSKTPTPVSWKNISIKKMAQLVRKKKLSYFASVSSL